MRITGNLFRILTLAALISILPAVGHASQKGTGPAAAVPPGIKISFKLDPRLTKSMYMGERWVSPPTYTSTVQDGKEITLDARAEVITAKGKATGKGPKWIPSDPGMVKVTPSQGNQVRVTVLRDGQSSLKVAAPGISRELSIKATRQGTAMQVEISQKP